jgi:hypothetical protein
MHFEIVGPISEVETIAAGSGIRILALLRKRYGKGRWRKLKALPMSGFPMVRYGRRKYTGLRHTASAREKCESSDTLIESNMSKHRNSTPRFAVCINTDDPDLLTHA